MSNLWFYIRFGRLFFQSSPDKWFTVKRAYAGAVYESFIGVYCLFGRPMV